MVSSSEVLYSSADDECEIIYGDDDDEINNDIFEFTQLSAVSLEEEEVTNTAENNENDNYSHKKKKKKEQHDFNSSSMKENLPFEILNEALITTESSKKKHRTTTTKTEEDDFRWKKGNNDENKNEKNKIEKKDTSGKLSSKRNLLFTPPTTRKVDAITTRLKRIKRNNKRNLEQYLASSSSSTSTNNLLLKSPSSLLLSQNLSSSTRNSMVGTRPMHWSIKKTTTTTIAPTPRKSLKSFLSSSNNKNSYNKSRAATIVPLSLRQGLFQKEVKKTKNDSTASTTRPKKINSFSPTFLGNYSPFVRKQQEENEDDLSFNNNHVTPSPNRSKKMKKSPGPLVTKLMKLRSTWNAEGVRLHSGMYNPYQDPRKRKQIMDVRLQQRQQDSSATPYYYQKGCHYFVRAEILSRDEDEKETTISWIVFTDRVPPLPNLRIYNPIVVKMPVIRTHTSTAVVASSQAPPPPTTTIPVIIAQLYETLP